MAGRIAKIVEAEWVAAARCALIDEGISGVKADRLAKALGVVRADSVITSTIAINYLIHYS